jgi:hypothetical protein
VSVVAQFEEERLCAHGRSLVPPVKTRDFGMTPEECKVEDFQIEPLPPTEREQLYPGRTDGLGSRD